MTDEEVFSAAVRFVNSITGLTTIKAYQAGPRPTPPYCMVNLTGTAEVRENPADTEYTDTGVPNPEGENEISAAPVIETEWRFSVHAYGDYPTGILRPVRAALQLSQTWEPHFPALTMFDVSQIRHLPEVVESKWEPRAQMDLFIRGYVRDGFVIDTIDQYSAEFPENHGV
ncbi:hypothetical protein JET14_13265 [Martelella lutilitoris]|uniref:Phage neck terminator protein gp12-like domain-containing protein n=1 Tax=Martelella lutilitoris TaxID=2583532 RepID=A0A7T7HHI3_9HYPH|nr:hypothetical protein [Martelella lutilitoris]QQM29296.1 hypothetical protein JET14_13265 [Martelella lutilitoris]